MHLAAIGNDLAIASILLTFPGIVNEDKNLKGQTPMDCAIAFKNDEVLRVLNGMGNNVLTLLLISSFKHDHIPNTLSKNMIYHCVSFKNMLENIHSFKGTRSHYPHF